VRVCMRVKARGQSGARQSMGMLACFGAGGDHGRLPAVRPAQPGEFLGRQLSACACIAVVRVYDLGCLPTTLTWGCCCRVRLTVGGDVRGLAPRQVHGTCFTLTVATYYTLTVAMCAAWPQGRSTAPISRAGVCMHVVGVGACNKAVRVGADMVGGLPLLSPQPKPTSLKGSSAGRLGSLICGWSPSVERTAEGSLEASLSQTGPHPSPPAGPP